MLAASIGFTCLLLVARAFYSGTGFYFFYIWNFLLAVIPLFISRQLSLQKKPWHNGVLLCIWLLFLPNAPYIVTDIIHFDYRPPVPAWFDLLIVASAAWNGLFAAIVSLLQVEHFLKSRYPRHVFFFMGCTVLLCGYGVYIGRFWRFNSWDVFTRPAEVMARVFSPVMNPLSHIPVWSFTIAFASMLLLAYYTVKRCTGPLQP